MRFLPRRLCLIAGFAVLLTGCSAFDSSDPPLPGERISVLELQRNIEPDSDALSAQGFVAPDAWRNEYWPQAGGYPSHSMQHLSLTDAPLEKLWSASIGKGSNKELPLTAQPVVVEGRVFALDTSSHLAAFDAQSGKKIWSVFVGEKSEDDEVIGGGIAYSRGLLYVTNGYAELLAVNPQSGEIAWRSALPTPVRAAPSIMNDRVFVTTLDNRLLALSAADGAILWEYAGISENAGLVGAASPAVSGEIVVPAFSSGELYALRIENGGIAWTENLSTFRRAGGMAGLSDIHGLPVIDKSLVIAISFGGKLVAIDERTGDRVWQREIGGSETPWVAGNHVFVISSSNELVALGRDNGIIRWVTQLPRFENEAKRKNPIFWTGPLYAGNRLIIAGTNGRVAEFSPEDGKLMREWSAGNSIRISPVVANATLYLLAENGTLSAYK